MGFKPQVNNGISEAGQPRLAVPRVRGPRVSVRGFSKRAGHRSGQKPHIRHCLVADISEVVQETRRDRVVLVQFEPCDVVLALEVFEMGVDPH